MKRLKDFSKTERERYNEIWNKLEKHIDEKTKRLLAAAMSLSLGYGGNKVMREITKLNPDTIKLGIEQITGKKTLDDNRIRGKGGGRKAITEVYPELEAELIKLVEANTQGDPESPLLWTSKSLNNLKEALEGKGFIVSIPVISELLSKNDYSMQANKRRFEGSTSENRNSQFEYINKTVKEAFGNQNPVISVDGKKKENVGNYANKGCEYHKKGAPIEVNAYDFPDKEKGKVTPYGVYDLAKNKGWVNVGCDHNTAEFAVFSIRQWWHKMGKELYPNADELIVTADGGGSNSSVSKLWKMELQKLSNEINIPITVCHFPPGTSKWNKIEHRMFSAISMNWRGRPLINHEVIINLISSTTNKSGLEIIAELDTKKYTTGIKVTDEQFESINIAFHTVNEKLNYTISPMMIESPKL
jgi:hypothetical protein